MNIEQALQKVLGFGVKEFIEKAIEGGYFPKGMYGTRANYLKRFELLAPAREQVNFILRDDGDQPPLESLSILRSYSDVLLDPLAWQAVGRVEGWERVCSDCGEEAKENEKMLVGESEYTGTVCGCGFDVQNLSIQERWIYNIHRFIDALAEQI